MLGPEKLLYFTPPPAEMGLPASSQLGFLCNRRNLYFSFHDKTP